MARIFSPANLENRQTVYGASTFVVEMLDRLNSLISGPNSGHGTAFRGGGPGTFGNKFNGPMPAQQNFQSRSVLQAPGSIRGQRAGANVGLPNSQPPAGIPVPLLDLLLPLGF